MRLTGIALCVLPLAAGAQLATRADSIHAELLNPAGKVVMVVAHWGDWHGTCENSLHAIQKAVEKGAKIATPSRCCRK